MGVTAGPDGAGGPRWLAWLLPVVALLPDLRAALPRFSYYARDFTVAFYPIHFFSARELASGRFPSWNPYIDEGTFQPPLWYPPDLLLAFWPTPNALSWLLTLHLPLAALGAYWLCRELGGDRWGGFVSGTVYALGGLAVSSLNLFVYLQALAWAPVLAVALRRAAVRGGRWIPLAALVTAVSVSTLAMEFVAQAVLLGAALGCVAAPLARALPRIALALALALALSALPTALILSILPETVRGRGFLPYIALQHAFEPSGFLDLLVPGFFGATYFASVYLGPCALGLALAGVLGSSGRARLVLLVLSGLALWFSLGAVGGLAPHVLSLPVLRSFRFPSKALLLPYLATAVWAGMGAARLRDGRGWRALGSAALLALGSLLLLAGLAAWRMDSLALWLHVPPESAALAAAPLASASLRGAGLGAALVLAALAVERRLVSSRMAATLAVTLLIFDLTQTAAGRNPQLPPGFFTPVPDLARQGLDRLEGGRVFSMGISRSPSMAAIWFLYRQVLGPYTNVLDGVEGALGPDFSAAQPRDAEILPRERVPEEVGRILPRLRNAAVTRILSLDPLEHPELRLLSRFPAGLPGMQVNLYEIRGAWPRAYVARHVVAAQGPSEALARPFEEGFDPARDVALEEPSPEGWGQEGRVRLRHAENTEREYDVVTDGPGYLVMRDSFARGWSCTVDSRPARVLRANGKHRAVAVPAGAHVVRLVYSPPGVRWGLAGTLVGALATLGLSLRPLRL